MYKVELKLETAVRGVLNRNGGKKLAETFFKKKFVKALEKNGMFFKIHFFCTGV